MIEATDLTLRTGRATLLEGVSVRLAPGEVVAVVGPNGAGKSSLLRALSGELRPARGTVALDGKPMSDWPADALARRRAVMSQFSPLAFAFTVGQVVEMGRHPHRGRRGAAEDAAAIAGAAELAGIAHLWDRSYPTLSGGEGQRVHLARALAQVWEPPGDEEYQNRYLLLDEPTASLDVAHQHGVMAAAAALARRGTGVLAVLHDLNLAARHADRMIVLRRGALAADGPPAAVLTPALLSDVYGMNAEVMTHPRAGCPFVVW